MKSLLIIFLFFGFVPATYTQVVETPGKDGMIDNIKTVKPQLLKGTFPEAKFLQNTDKGKVFALPIDNMPCLVPKITGNTPIVGFDMNRFKKIPNAFREFKVIPIIELPKTDAAPVPGK